jgi:phospholipid/cholesterol/gamma-HCH transport system substrate-binding protein
VKLAIKRHSGDFIAVIVMLILAIAVTGFILHEEGVRFPFVQSSPFTINADFSTAQAVTPGQGQSVNVSGVKVGLITGVTTKDGYAVVQMAIDQKYKRLIHTNATALLRPKTGLQDMFVELNPGTSKAPVAKPGYTLPLAHTNPEVNLDEVLASLDSDTRQYLDLLVNGAGQGVQGRSSDLTQVLERFEPTHRDLARLNGAIAKRGRDLQQLVHSLQRLNTALATRKTQITQMIDSSSRVFAALASEEGNISRSVKDLPGTLAQTAATLQKVKVFAQLLGPTAHKLLPAAKALPAANHALAALAKPAAPILQNQIRPFVIAARPVVRSLRPAAVRLAAATPSLSRTFVTVNHFLNILGYFPHGTRQHGYLWWLAWLGHVGRTVFSVQDGNGDFRQAFLQMNCSTIAQIAQSLSPQLLQVLEPTLINLLGTSGVCPSQSKALTAAYARYKGSSGQSSNPSLAASALSVMAPGEKKLLSQLQLGNLLKQHLFLPKLPTG